MPSRSTVVHERGKLLLTLQRIPCEIDIAPDETHVTVPRPAALVTVAPDEIVIRVSTQIALLAEGLIHACR